MSKSSPPPTLYKRQDINRSEGSPDPLVSVRVAYTLILTWSISLSSYKVCFSENLEQYSFSIGTKSIALEAKNDYSNSSLRASPRSVSAAQPWIEKKSLETAPPPGSSLDGISILEIRISSLVPSGFYSACFPFPSSCIFLSSMIVLHKSLS